MNLQEVLMKKTVPDLKHTASLYTDGYSKLKKAELVALCMEMILDKNMFEAYAEFYPESLWDFVKQAAESENGTVCTGDPFEYTVLEELGLAHVVQEEKGVRFILADEIKERYRKLVENGFVATVCRRGLIHRYLCAAVNLYGVIEQMELMRIFDVQNDPPMTMEELADVLDSPLGYDEVYAVKENYIVNPVFAEENGEEEMDKLLVDAYSKPRYIPEKKEFLRYTDPDYREYTEHTADLEQFLQKEYKVSAMDAFEIAHEFAIMASFTVDVQNYVDLLKDYDIEVKYIEPLLRQIALCANNVRIWENKGYTPNELHAMKQSMARVGRNDPCPCGSGKKYKKCCGK